MFSILLYLIIPIFSTYSLNGEALEITGETSITPEKVSGYKGQIKKCTITTRDILTIKSKAFLQFSGLEEFTITAESVTFESQSFQMTSIDAFRIKTTTGTVIAESNSFIMASIKSFEVESVNTIAFLTHSAAQLIDMETLKLISQNGGVNFSTSALISSTIETISIQAKTNILFDWLSFKGVSFKEMHISAGGNVNFDLGSFQNSAGETFIVESGGKVQFRDRAFHATKNLQNFTVIANSDIDFDSSSFNETSAVNATIVSKSGSIYFYVAFGNCTNLSSITVKAAGSIRFYANSFSSSSIAFVDVSQYEENGKLKLLVDTGLTNSIIIYDSAFENCNNLKEVSLSSAKSIIIETNAFAESASLQTVKINSKDVTVRSQAFKNCESLETVSIKAEKKQVDADAYEGCDNLQPEKDNADPENNGLTGGQIAGIVIGVLVGVAVIAFCVYWFVFRNNSSKSNNEDAVA